MSESKNLRLVFTLPYSSRLKMRCVAAIKILSYVGGHNRGCWWVHPFSGHNIGAVFITFVHHSFGTISRRTITEEKKQGRRGPYNLTLRHVRGKAINITYLCVCVCVRSCVRKRGSMQGVCMRVRACMYSCLSNTKRVCAILWCHLWPLWLHHIFRHYLINGAIFGKKLLNIKCVSWFSLQSLFKTFLILRRI
jgi:hypothetical protein